jgi:hypothetical protein
MNDKSMGRQESRISESILRRSMMSANSPVVQRWFKRSLVAVGILAVGLIVGSFVVTPPPAETQSAAVVTDSLQRGMDASAARYTAMAASYAAENDGLQRGMDASAARYTAMAASYAAKNDGLQRGIDASAARYTAMAASYAAENDSLQRGMDASAARYTAMAASYAAKEE